MRKVITLAGKNLPRLAVAKPGWPGIPTPRRWITKEEALERWPPPKAIKDFTRVCDQTGLSEKLRKD